MIRARHVPFARHRMAGLSLIEMMIAMVMALIVAAGIITVFTSTSSSNQVQAQMATLQEAGRFAIHSLRADLANANGGYCSNSGGNAGQTGSGLFLDALRSPIVYAKDALDIPDNTLTIATPSQAYVLPSFLYMRGYDCTTSACTPTDPNTTVSAIPAMGTGVGDRVVGASVLTVRYLRPGSGWALVPAGSAHGSTITATGGVATAITLNPLTGEDPVTDFKAGDAMMLATCSLASVYAVGDSGGVLTPTGSNYSQPPDISPQPGAAQQPAAPRVFDLNQDFQTITYFLKVVCTDGTSPCDHTTGELVRRVNGVDQPLVRGVERLDFRYGVMDANGGTRFLSANEVDTAVDAAGNSITCPPQMPPLSGVTPDTTAGCLWRAVQTIEVHVLMDGQTPLYTLTPAEMNYLYSLDGTSGGTTPTKPSAHPIRPKADQGFPEHVIRREFTTLASLRNFNP